MSTLCAVPTKCTPLNVRSLTKSLRRSPFSNFGTLGNSGGTFPAYYSMVGQTAFIEKFSFSVICTLKLFGAL